MFWLILLIVFCFLGYKGYKFFKKQREEDEAYLEKYFPYRDFNFPNVDADGNELQNKYSIELTGSHHDKNGTNPQLFIRSIKEGDPVVFRHQVVKGFPSAYYAFDAHGNPLGWLPENDLHRDTIVRRLERNLTVLACAQKKGSYTTSDGEVYTSLFVKVAVYALPKETDN